MAAGIREILLITNPADESAYKSLLGDGSMIGIRLTFATQDKPRGIAEAFLIAEEFLAGSAACLILGDNIFHGSGLGRQLMEFTTVKGAQIFAYSVSNPRDYGVVEFDKKGIVISVEEKPINPKSTFAIPGLYFFENSVIGIAKKIQPSPRGELEITAVISQYLKKSLLNVSILPRGTAWLDTGSIQSLHDASSYIRIIEERQGSKVGCIEEVAWRQGWIEDGQLQKIAQTFASSPYSDYLQKLLRTQSLPD